MKIIVTYRNKNLDIIGEEEFSIEEYCNLLSQKTLSLLYQIDDVVNNKLDYQDVKKYIFNLAGSIQRMPKNIHQEEVKSKQTDRSFVDFILRRDG